MLVKIEKLSYGYLLTPVNKKMRKQILTALTMNSDPNPDYTIFFQSFEDLENLEFIPDNQLKELDKGWDVTIRVYNYEFLNLYGYDVKDLVK